MNLVEKLKRIPYPLKDKDTLLKTITIVFVSLPILFLIYLQLVTIITQVGLKEILYNDTAAVLGLISNFSAVYAGYAINVYRKEMSKENTIGFYLILISQILLLQPLTIMLMLMYVFKFIGFKNIISDVKNQQWKKSYKALLPSLIVLTIAIIVMFIKVRISA